jgi:urease accessory protein UreE
MEIDQEISFGKRISKHLDKADDEIKNNIQDSDILDHDDNLKQNSKTVIVVKAMKCKLIVCCKHQSRWVENESRKSNEICQANAVNSMKRTVL